jgi:hypothetical protein
MPDIAQDQSLEQIAKRGRVKRLATETQAAEEVGLDLATFREWVKCGRLPKPLPDCNKYDLKAIDAALDRISGLGQPSNVLDAWRERHNAGGNNAR